MSRDKFRLIFFHQVNNEWRKNPKEYAQDVAEYRHCLFIAGWSIDRRFIGAEKGVGLLIHGSEFPSSY